MSDGADLLIDTHVWVWLLQARDDRVPISAERQLKAASQDGRLVVSVMSVWEIAMLVTKGRLTVPVALDDWINNALRAPGLRLLELTPAIAVESTRLPGGAPKDPADRILLASARELGATFATADREILAYARRTRAVRVLKAGK